MIIYVDQNVNRICRVNPCGPRTKTKLHFIHKRLYTHDKKKKNEIVRIKRIIIILS
jgi:hypothetical protein